MIENIYIYTQLHITSTTSMAKISYCPVTLKTIYKHIKSKTISRLALKKYDTKKYLK